jgi:hypothetical protein
MVARERLARAVAAGLVEELVEQGCGTISAPWLHRLN